MCQSFSMDLCNMLIILHDPHIHQSDCLYHNLAGFSGWKPDLQESRQWHVMFLKSTYKDRFDGIDGILRGQDDTWKMRGSAKCWSLNWRSAMYSSRKKCNAGKMNAPVRQNVECKAYVMNDPNWWLYWTTWTRGTPSRMFPFTIYPNCHKQNLIVFS